MTGELEVIQGSSNVFADFGDPGADAALARVGAGDIQCIRNAAPDRWSVGLSARSPAPFGPHSEDPS